jgi:hypothetical protein
MNKATDIDSVIFINFILKILSLPSLKLLVLLRPLSGNFYEDATLDERITGDNMKRQYEQTRDKRFTFRKKERTSSQFAKPVRDEFK